jgi:hypothetical protein
VSCKYSRSKALQCENIKFSRAQNKYNFLVFIYLAYKTEVPFFDEIAELARLGGIFF